jgi:hypothetical protein
MIVVGLAIGYFMGILTTVVLNCCIVFGNESRKEEKDELTKK